MEATTPLHSKLKGMAIIALAIWASCWLLFALDKDTHHFSDLLKPGNLVALAIYFIPTFLICTLLFSLLKKKHSNAKSLTRSLLIGIPLSLTLIILLLIALKPH